MRIFARPVLDTGILSQNLNEPEAVLSSEPHLKERDRVLPFFEARPHPIAALGLANNSVELPDRRASEPDLSGDLVRDVAPGDSEANAYTLVGFEPAPEHGVFSRLPAGKAMRSWSPRYEHGLSRLVDRAWRLSSRARRPPPPAGSSVTTRSSTSSR